MISPQLTTLWPPRERGWMTSGELPTLAALPWQTGRSSRTHAIGRPSAVGPVLFVLDEDPTSLDVLLSDLTRRFGTDFTVTGDTSSETAVRALQEMAAASEPVALLLVNEDAIDFLARAHELHPRLSACCWSIATTPRRARQCRRSLSDAPTITSSGPG